MKNRNETTYGTGVKLVLFIMLYILFGGCAVGNGAVGDNKRELSAPTLRTVARVYMAYGQYDKAEPLAKQALAVAEKNNLSDDQRCLCLIDLAYIYGNTGRFELAEQNCLAGLELLENVYGQDHPYAAYTLRILASVYRQQGKFEQAQVLLEQGMDIMRKTIGLADPRAVAPFQIDLANLFIQQARYNEAESYFAKALPAVSDTFGPEHLYTANLLGNIAKLYVLQGRFSQAEMLITQAVSVQEKVYGTSNYLVAPSWLTMANVCWAKGDTAQAEKLIQKALAAVEKTGNVTEMVLLQRQVSQIRSTKPSAYGLIAKAS